MNKDICTTGSHYCSYCKRVIVASNIEEYKSGEHDGYLYIHDDVPHPDTEPEEFCEVIH